RLLWQVPPEALRVREGPSPSGANGSAVDLGRGRVTDVVDLGRTVEVVVELSSGIEIRARTLEVPDLSVGAACRVETDSEAMSVWSAPAATGTPGETARLG
ncbi:MAG TPA: TOBE domain-containing protein, partial [Streptosporangiaceae bacterium]|nr:TOBE domain-containing protein [Streptosporangiaceae bacterium]